MQLFDLLIRAVLEVVDTCSKEVVLVAETVVHGVDQSSEMGVLLCQCGCVVTEARQLAGVLRHFLFL